MDTVTLSPNRVYATAVCNKIVNDTDSLGKISKVVWSILEIGAYVISGASKTFKDIGLIFKDFNDLTGSIGIIDRAAELLDPELRKEGYKDWKHTSGKISKISLIAGQILSFVSFVDKATYKSLTGATWCLGRLPVIDLIKNAAFAVNSVVTIYTTVKKLQSANDPIAKKTVMLKIAAEVSKLFMITIGTYLGIFAGYASTPFLIGVAVLGFFTNATGLAENFWKNVFSKTAHELIKDKEIFPADAEVAQAG